MPASDASGCRTRVRTDPGFAACRSLVPVSSVSIGRERSRGPFDERVLRTVRKSGECVLHCALAVRGDTMIVSKSFCRVIGPGISDTGPA